MRGDDDWGYAGVMALAFAAFLYGLWTGFGGGVQSVRTQAVKRGFAERVVQPDGSTEFRWRESE